MRTVLNKTLQENIYVSQFLPLQTQPSVTIRLLRPSVYGWPRVALQHLRWNCSQSNTHLKNVKFTYIPYTLLYVTPGHWVPGFVSVFTCSVYRRLEQLSRQKSGLALAVVAQWDSRALGIYDQWPDVLQLGIGAAEVKICIVWVKYCFFVVVSCGYSSELILLKVGFILNFLTNGDQSNMIDAVRETYVFDRVSLSPSLD